MRRVKERAAFISGLRELADFFEHHPEFPSPRQRTINVFCSDDVESIAEVARMLGKCTKFDHTYEIGLRREFSGVALQVRWPHNRVCKRVSTGKKIVDSYATEWKKVESLEYKWVCPTSFLNACCEEEKS